MTPEEERELTTRRGAAWQRAGEALKKVKQLMFIMKEVVDVPRTALSGLHTHT